MQSVTFKRVGPGGADFYELVFEHGKLECGISLTADGKTQGISLRPI